MVRGGNAHFFTYTRIRSRETGENRKTNEQTKLGVNQEQRKVCNTTCMCIPDSRYGLTLARVTSENSTMLLESDILRLFFTGPYLVSSPLCSVSGVDCPSVDPRQPLCSPLSCPAATAFCCLPLCSPATNSPLSCPTTNFLSLVLASLWAASSTLILGSSHQLFSLLSNYQLPLLGRVVNSHSPPRTTSGYGEISCPRILCLVSRQNRLVCFGGLPPSAT